MKKTLAVLVAALLAAGTLAAAPVQAAEYDLDQVSERTLTFAHTGAAGSANEFWGDEMKAAIEETERRRKIQMAYNEEHGITPQTIKKAVRDLIAISKSVAKEDVTFQKDPESMSKKELEKLIAQVEKRMKKAAAELDFESAATLRDQLFDLKVKYNG